MVTPDDEAELIRKYTPLLVLYPEIPENIPRKKSDNYPHASPLDYDYHPRDIKLVLENSTLHSRFRLGRGNRVGWEEMLNKMERGKYEKNIELYPPANPKENKRYWAAYGKISKVQEKYERVCYARILSDVGMKQNRIVIQYWYAYFYNDFWNTHEMDWETVMVVLAITDDGPLPTICAYSAHLGGHWLRWENIEKANDEGLRVEDEELPVDDEEERVEDGSHPVVYVANGSHANYFYELGLYPTAPPLAAMAASLVKKNKRLADYTTSWKAGSKHLVEAKVIPQVGEDEPWTGEWRWLNQTALWGSKGKWG